MQGGGVRCMPDERPGEGTNLLCRYQAPNKNGHGRVCREILVDIHSSDDHQSEEGVNLVVEVGCLVLKGPESAWGGQQQKRRGKWASLG